MMSLMLLMLMHASLLNSAASSMAKYECVDSLLSLQSQHHNAFALSQNFVLWKTSINSCLLLLLCCNLIPRPVYCGHYLSSVVVGHLTSAQKDDQTQLSTNHSNTPQHHHYQCEHCIIIIDTTSPLLSWTLHHSQWIPPSPLRR